VPHSAKAPKKEKEKNGVRSGVKWNREYIFYKKNMRMKSEAMDHPPHHDALSTKRVAEHNHPISHASSPPKGNTNQFIGCSPVAHIIIHLSIYLSYPKLHQQLSNIKQNLSVINSLIQSSLRYA
jgi:hypothetical protein